VFSELDKQGQSDSTNRRLGQQTKPRYWQSDWLGHQSNETWFADTVFERLIRPNNFLFPIYIVALVNSDTLRHSALLPMPLLEREHRFLKP